jgi:zeaxanthin glucosyltransferase
MCDAVSADVTAVFDATRQRLGDRGPAVDDAFKVHGREVVYLWPDALHAPDRRPLLPARHRSVGPLVRAEQMPAEIAARLARSDRPLVYAALGTFLSHRADTLATIAGALRQLDVRAAIATGPTAPTALGPIPDDWIVAPRLPQVALLHHAAVAVSHAGNNSVQEALAAACPQIVLPFSTDQFAIAADLERADLAAAFDPNTVTAAELAAAIESSLAATVPIATMR